jgi:hypothetical protein
VHLTGISADIIAARSQPQSGAFFHPDQSTLHPRPTRTCHSRLFSVRVVGASGELKANSLMSSCLYRTEERTELELFLAKTDKFAEESFAFIQNVTTYRLAEHSNFPNCHKLANLSRSGN